MQQCHYFVATFALIIPNAGGLKSNHKAASRAITISHKVPVIMANQQVDCNTYVIGEFSS